MGKPITDEQKYKVISLWYQSQLRDKIAKITGIGKGTVSNILKEFKEKMGQGDFEVIKTHARLIRELELDHEIARLEDFIRMAENKLKMTD